MKRLLPYFLATLVATSLSANVEAARMYEWQNPNTGTVELSGKPPAWYRGTRGGPRVRVFDDGVLVDDTVIELPPKFAEQQRESAFSTFDRQQQAEAVKRLERVARKQREAQRRAAERAGTLQRTEPVASAETTSPAEREAIPENLDENVINSLKQLIQTWDQQLTGAEATK